MKTPNIKTIAAELNKRASGHLVGRLQEIRAELHHRGPGGNIFRPASIIRNDYAFHYGGRRELQFNIAWDDVDGAEKLRHGVGFSFEPSRSVQNLVTDLKPKVSRFNRFIRLHSDLYDDMRMWHYNPEEDKTIGPYKPRPIPQELLIEGVFVFLGKLQSGNGFGYEVILNDFDRLLELYEFTEGGRASQSISVPVKVETRTGNLQKALSTIATHVRKQWKVVLRQNKLQQELCRRLQLQFGGRNVIPEFRNVGGTRTDIKVLRKNGDWLYEIKTAASAGGCVREAFGQLLEYAFWPPAARIVSRLIVVGEATMDEECQKYLQLLKRRFRLPIEYQQMKA